MGNTVDAQPGTDLSMKNLTQSAHTVTSILTTKTEKPTKVTSRNGTTEKDVIAFSANAIILRVGYLDSPANLLERS